MVVPFFVFHPRLIRSVRRGTLAKMIEEDIGDPLPDAADVLIDPARVQRFEDCLSPEQHTRGFLLMLRIFSCYN